VTKYATVRCRVCCQSQPNAWKTWENQAKQFLRERAGPGKVPNGQRQPGEPLFNWTVTFRDCGAYPWEYFYYDVWFKDPAMASLFTLAFSEYLDD
jgi:hypothetical protein